MTARLTQLSNGTSSSSFNYTTWTE